MNVSELKKRLTVEMLPVYFLKGHDAFLKNWAIKIFSELTDPDYADFNVVAFEDAADMRGIIDALNTVPVFADRRIVIVKSGDDLDDGDKSRLETYLKNPAEFALLVFVDDIVSADESNRKESPLHTMYKYGDVVDCNNVSETQFVEWINLSASRKNKKIDAAAVRMLGQYTAFDMTKALIEFDKLLAYAGGETVTADMVDTLVAADTEYKTYALANALGDGDNDGALKILQSLMDKGESPSAVLSSIYGQYRRMLETRVSNLPPDDLAKALGVKVGAISIAKKTSLKYSPVELKAVVDKLHNLEYSFKSGEKDELSVLHEAFAFLLKKK